jgi:predicted transcriptional regulator
MTLAASPQPHYLYDPQETLDQFRARQAHAYALGRRAWRERRIKAHLLPFYETLVGYVGQNQYTWVKEQTLADEFAVHVATIKRWLAKLEEAGLIRRQRRFATSSLTYMTAYDATQVPIKNTDNLHKIQNKAPEKVDYRQEEAASVARKNAPTLSADLPPDSIKSKNLTVGGSGTPNTQRQPVDAAAELLQQEGITDYYLLPAIHGKPVDELRAISTYLDRQRRVRDRPRLFAWLASRDFGRQLMNGRRRLEHDDQRAARQCQHRSFAESPRAIPAPHQAARPQRDIDDVLQRTWQDVLHQLQQAVPPDTFTTWLADTRLLALDDRAVVGTPHVFARDMLCATYLPQVQHALAAVLQHAPGVTVVVDR